MQLEFTLGDFTGTPLAALEAELLKESDNEDSDGGDDDDEDDDLSNNLRLTSKNTANSVREIIMPGMRQQPSPSNDVHIAEASKKSR